MSGSKKEWLTPEDVNERKHYDVFSVDGFGVKTHLSEHARYDDAADAAKAYAASDFHFVENLGMPDHWFTNTYHVRTRPSKAHTILKASWETFRDEWRADTKAFDEMQGYS